MKTILPAVFLMLIVSSHLIAQSTFNRITPKKKSTFGIQPFDDIARTNTGGYAYIDGADTKAYLTVMDSNYNLLWAKTLQITGNRTKAISVAQSATDSSFLVTGVTSAPNRPEYDFFTALYSPQGILLHTNVYLYGNSSGDPMKLIPLPDGSYLLGLNNGGSQTGLIRLDSAGVPQSVTSLSYQNRFLLFQNIIPLAEGGYMLTGNFLYNYGDGKRDIFCTKLDADLNVQWTRLYESGQEQEVTSILQTRDSGFLVQGYDIKGGGNVRARMLKIDRNGNVQWNRTGRFSSNYFPTSAVEDSDGSYVMTALNFVKIDKDGNFLWSSNQQFEGFLSAVIKAKDEGFVAFASADSYLYAIKIDSAGNSCNYSYRDTYNEESDTLWTEDITLASSPSYYSVIPNSGATDAAASISEFGICSGSVLPVQLLSFSAVHDGRQNKLVWNTATANSALSFDVERSTDGVSFQKLGTTAAKENTSAYTFTDALPAGGRNYYRLKMTDRDGHSVYSDVRLLQNDAPLLASLLLNPVKNTLPLAFSSVHDASVQLRITNMQGTTVQSASLQVAGSSLTTSLDVSRLPAGLYILSVSSAAQQVRLKFIKE